MSLSVEIVAPDRILWTGKAKFISVPSVEGSMGLLPGHEPCLSLLGQGTVKVVTVDEQDWTLDIVRGYVSFDHDNVTIVARPVTAPAAA